jgi:DNA-directed RNA polymerase subunit RPC12/RpoP
MKIIPLKCPECGADINIEDGVKQFYCSHCGTRLTIDDETKTVIIRHIDEAKIKETVINGSLRIKEMEIHEKKRKDAETLMLFWILIMAIVGLVALAIIVSSGKDSNSPGYILILFDLLILLIGAIILSDKRSSM